MIYFTLDVTPEGQRLAGLSEGLDSLGLPAGSVNVDDLTIPAAITSLGITTWEKFNEESLTPFYIYSGGTLVTRSIDYWQYLEGTSNSVIVYKFTAETSETQTNNSFQTAFIQSVYTAEGPTSPLSVYATVEGATYNSQTYALGQELVLYGNPAPSVPTDFTNLVPPTPVSEDNYLQWTGSAWLAPAFPYTYSLVDAQEALTSLVKTNGANHVFHQLRSHSLYEIVTSASPGNLLPADSVTNGYTTISSYQSAVDALVGPKLTTISTATAVSDLYTFDPSVPAP